MTSSTEPSEPTLLRAALGRCRPIFVGLLGFSAALHILGLAGPVFSLQVFDRVLNGRSMVTLALLLGITLFLLSLQALLEGVRSRLLVRAGIRFDDLVAAPVFDRLVAAGVATPRNAAHANAFRDLDQVREALAGPAALALLDAPYIPLYLLICFILHPLIGLVVVVCGVALAGLAVLNEVGTRASLRRAQIDALGAAERAAAAHRHAEVVQALGMVPAVRGAWTLSRDRMLGWQAQASDRTGGISAASRWVRMLLPVLATAVGAALVVRGDITAGVLIASSMLAARALMPIDQLVTSWRGLQGARLAWERLEAMMAETKPTAPGLPLPRPIGHLDVTRLVAVPPGSRQPALRGISFSLQPGQILGVVGPSGSGKSTLARALLGLQPALAGEIRLDGARLDQRNPDTLGRDLGYLPQDSVLFAGTVAENIARFQPDASAEQVLDAARAAGVHDLILALPDGYDTRVGDGGQGLSGGQRQRIALARALYGSPALVVLDEPNAALDGAGEDALAFALSGLKARGCAVVLMTHRIAVLGATDILLVLDGGLVRAFGPRDQVIAALSRPTPPADPQPQSTMTHEVPA